MKSTSAALQLKLISDARIEQKPAQTDLLNRLFFDGRSYIRVVALCHQNSSQVIVEREINGQRWTISAGLIRMITSRERRKKIAWRWRGLFTSATMCLRQQLRQLQLSS